MDNYFIAPSRIHVLGSQIRDISNAKGLLGSVNGPTQAGLYERMRAMGEEAMPFSVKGGTAVIPVQGALASCQIPGWFWGAEMTYEMIVASVQRAVADPEVSRVLLQINSPGGTVLGCAEAAAEIDKLSAVKPIWAHCAMADSAAYWLASATNHISVDTTGEVGSIGVIMSHYDVSKMFEEWGISVTHIHSGARKADGSMFAPLSDEAKERFQEDCDYLRGIFADTVSRYRQISRDSVLATEARTYIGELAVQAQLADSTGFLPDILAAFTEAVPEAASILTPSKRSLSMAKNIPKKSTKLNPAASEDEDKKNKDNPDAAQDDPEDENEPESSEDSPEEEDDEGENGGDKSASEKTRIKSILGCTEAKGRTALAEHIAFNTDMSVKSAKAMLAAAPTSGSTDENPLATAMRRQGNPSVSGSGKPDKSCDNPLLATAQRFTPRRLKQQ